MQRENNCVHTLPSLLFHCVSLINLDCKVIFYAKRGFSLLVNLTLNEME